MPRFITLTISVAALVALVPVLLLIAVLVRIFLGSPILFWQIRAGINGKPFRMIKFRTMTDAKDRQGRLLADGERLTHIGQLLRSTSLDELPELWNVIKGDMNLVGPRPLLMEYLPLYSARQARRHDVPPGITGWAQVNGRNALSWDEKFELDLWYVEHRSTWLDFKILLLTLLSVIRRRGISQYGEATMAPFRGSPRE